MLETRGYSAFGVSLVVHSLVLAAMAMIKMSLLDAHEHIAVETVFTEDRVQEEFSKELEVETEVATTMNTVSGGVVSTQVGSAAGPTVNQVKIETSEVLKDPVLKVNVGDITIPGDSLLGQDLGEGEVTGEVGAVVEGYGAALSRLTQEIIRLMREQKVLVVWLFDESESMKDDQVEIQQKFHKVYDELGIAQKKDAELKKGGADTLLTAIHSYGERLHFITPEPTTDIEEIKKAIAMIPIDESGLENTCQSISLSIDKYRQIAAKQKRRLVIVVVSDESGDDGEGVEPTLVRAKQANAPIYILGRESIFGYPYARLKWQDPKYKLWHWLQINRGPETAMPECLQWDGLHGRWDSFSSGFGPYEQVRLAKETGGIFFVLPGEEEDLTGAGANDKRKFDFLAMKEYQPLLEPRREYEKERDSSKFRKTIWDVIVTLNPHLDKQLNIREHWYSIDPAEFKQQGQGEFQKAMYAMGLCSQAVKLLEGIKPLRAKEDSQRWRAAYDLALAQCLSYRVRLFQFLLAMDQHAKNPPKIQKPDTNRWNLGRTKAMLPPDPEQVKLTKVDPDELNRQLQQAQELYGFVIGEHPGTPWARRAQHELNIGFGMQFHEAHRDPNYDRPDIKVPKF